MSSQIEFDNLDCVMPEILEEVNSSELLNCRLVSVRWRDQCESALGKLWNKLQKNPPGGIVDIGSRMTRINDELKDSHIFGFAKLARVFRMHRAVLPALSLPIRITDFQLLQDEVLNVVLRTFSRYKDEANAGV